MMGEIKQSVQIGSYNRWIRVDAIFDTGATASYVKESLAKKINALPYGKVKTYLADGSEVWGRTAQINIKIQKRIGLVDVIILPKLDGDLFLGQDFLQKNEVILDMRRETLIFGRGQPKEPKLFKLRKIRVKR